MDTSPTLPFKVHLAYSVARQVAFPVHANNIHNHLSHRAYLLAACSLDNCLYNGSILQVVIFSHYYYVPVPLNLFLHYNMYNLHPPSFSDMLMFYHAVSIPGLVGHGTSRQAHNKCNARFPVSTPPPPFHRPHLSPVPYPKPRPTSQPHGIRPAVGPVQVGIGSVLLFCG